MFRSVNSLSTALKSLETDNSGYLPPKSKSSTPHAPPISQKKKNFRRNQKSSSFSYPDEPLESKAAQPSSYSTPSSPKSNNKKNFEQSTVNSKDKNNSKKEISFNNNDNFDLIDDIDPELLKFRALNIEVSNFQKEIIESSAKVSRIIDDIDKVELILPDDELMSNITKLGKEIIEEKNNTIKFNSDKKSSIILKNEPINNENNTDKIEIENAEENKTENNNDINENLSINNSNEIIENNELNSFYNTDNKIKLNYYESQLLRSSALLPIEYFNRNINVREVNSQLNDLNEELEFSNKNWVSTMQELNIVKALKLNDQSLSSNDSPPMPSSSLLPVDNIKPDQEIYVPKINLPSANLVKDDDDYIIVSKLKPMDKSLEKFFTFLKKLTSGDDSLKEEFNLTFSQIKKNALKRMEDSMRQKKQEIVKKVNEINQEVYEKEVLLTQLRTQYDNLDSAVRELSSQENEMRDLVQSRYKDTINQLSDHILRQEQKILQCNEEIKISSKNLRQIHTILDELKLKGKDSSPFIKRRGLNLVKGLIELLDEEDFLIQHEKETKIKEYYDKIVSIRNEYLALIRKISLMKEYAEKIDLEIEELKESIPKEKLIYREKSQQLRAKDIEISNKLYLLEMASKELNKNNKKLDDITIINTSTKKNINIIHNNETLEKEKNYTNVENLKLICDPEVEDSLGVTLNEELRQAMVTTTIPKSVKMTNVIENNLIQSELKENQETKNKQSNISNHNSENSSPVGVVGFSPFEDVETKEDEEEVEEEDEIEEVIKDNNEEYGTLIYNKNGTHISPIKDQKIMRPLVCPIAVSCYASILRQYKLENSDDTTDINDSDNIEKETSSQIESRINSIQAINARRRGLASLNTKHSNLKMSFSLLECVKVSQMVIKLCEKNNYIKSSTCREYRLLLKNLLEQIEYFNTNNNNLKSFTFSLHQITQSIIIVFYQDGIKKIASDNNKKVFINILNLIYCELSIILNFTLSFYDSSSYFSEFNSIWLENLVKDCIEIVIGYGNKRIILNKNAEKLIQKRNLNQDDDDFNIENAIHPDVLIEFLIYKIFLVLPNEYSSKFTNTLQNLFKLEIFNYFPHLEQFFPIGNFNIPKIKRSNGDLFQTNHRNCLKIVQLLFFTLFGHKNYSNSEITNYFFEFKKNANEIGNTKSTYLDTREFVSVHHIDDLLMQLKTPIIIPLLFSLELMVRVIDEDLSNRRFLEKIETKHEDYLDIQHLDIMSNPSLLLERRTLDKKFKKDLKENETVLQDEKSQETDLNKGNNVIQIPSEKKSDEIIIESNKFDKFEPLPSPKANNLISLTPISPAASSPLTPSPSQSAMPKRFFSIDTTIRVNSKSEQVPETKLSKIEMFNNYNRKELYQSNQKRRNTLNSIRMLSEKNIHRYVLDNNYEGKNEESVENENDSILKTKQINKINNIFIDKEKEKLKFSLLKSHEEWLYNLENFFLYLSKEINRIVWSTSEGVYAGYDEEFSDNSSIKSVSSIAESGNLKVLSAQIKEKFKNGPVLPEYLIYKILNYVNKIHKIVIPRNNLNANEELFSYGSDLLNLLKEIRKIQQKIIMKTNAITTPLREKLLWLSNRKNEILNEKAKLKENIANYTNILEGIKNEKSDLVKSFNLLLFEKKSYISSFGNSNRGVKDKEKNSIKFDDLKHGLRINLQKYSFEVQKLIIMHVINEKKNKFNQSLIDKSSILQEIANVKSQLEVLEEESRSLSRASMALNSVIESKSGSTSRYNFTQTSDNSKKKQIGKRKKSFNLNNRYKKPALYSQPSESLKEALLNAEKALVDPSLQIGLTLEQVTEKEKEKLKTKDNVNVLSNINNSQKNEKDELLPDIKPQEIFSLKPLSILEKEKPLSSSTDTKKNDSIYLPTPTNEKINEEIDCLNLKIEEKVNDVSKYNNECYLELPNQSSPISNSSSSQLNHNSSEVATTKPIHPSDHIDINNPIISSDSSRSKSSSSETNLTPTERIDPSGEISSSGTNPMHAKAAIPANEIITPSEPRITPSELCSIPFDGNNTSPDPLVYNPKSNSAPLEENGNKSTTDNIQSITSDNIPKLNDTSGNLSHEIIEVKNISPEHTEIPLSITANQNFIKASSLENDDEDELNQIKNIPVIENFDLINDENLLKDNGQAQNWNLNSTAPHTPLTTNFQASQILIAPQPPTLIEELSNFSETVSQSTVFNDSNFYPFNRSDYIDDVIKNNQLSLSSTSTINEPIEDDKVIHNKVYDILKQYLSKDQIDKILTKIKDENNDLTNMINNTDHEVLLQKLLGNTDDIMNKNIILKKNIYFNKEYELIQKIMKNMPKELAESYQKKYDKLKQMTYIILKDYSYRRNTIESERRLIFNKKLRIIKQQELELFNKIKQYDMKYIKKDMYNNEDYVTKNNELKLKILTFCKKFASGLKVVSSTDYNNTFLTTSDTSTIPLSPPSLIDQNEKKKINLNLFLQRVPTIPEENSDILNEKSLNECSSHEKSQRSLFSHTDSDSSFKNVLSSKSYLKLTEAVSSPINLKKQKNSRIYFPRTKKILYFLDNNFSDSDSDQELTPSLQLDKSIQGRKERIPINIQKLIDIRDKLINEKDNKEKNSEKNNDEYNDDDAIKIESDILNEYTELIFNKEESNNNIIEFSDEIDDDEQFVDNGEEYQNISEDYENLDSLDSALNYDKKKRRSTVRRSIFNKLKNDDDKKKSRKTSTLRNNFPSTLTPLPNQIYSEEINNEIEKIYNEQVEEQRKQTELNNKIKKEIKTLLKDEDKVDEKLEKDDEIYQKDKEIINKMKSNLNYEISFLLNRAKEKINKTKNILEKIKLINQNNQEIQGKKEKKKYIYNLPRDNNLEILKWIISTSEKDDSIRTREYNKITWKDFDINFKVTSDGTDYSNYEFNNHYDMPLISEKISITDYLEKQKKIKEGNEGKEIDEKSIINIESIQDILRNENSVEFQSNFPPTTPYSSSTPRPPTHPNSQKSNISTPRQTKRSSISSSTNSNSDSPISSRPLSHASTNRNSSRSSGRASPSPHSSRITTPFVNPTSENINPEDTISTAQLSSLISSSFSKKNSEILKNISVTPPSTSAPSFFSPRKKI